MHRCLRLTEILEIIFCLVLDVQLIDPGFSFYQLLQPAILPFPNTEGRRSVLNLALTCHAFYDPALNVLHSHIGGIWPLIKFLPDQLDLSPRPSSVPTPKQFRLSVLRATRVQILFNHNFRRDDSAYALLLAGAHKDAPLFPQLRSLGWFDSRVENIPVLNLLLPTVHTLALDITDNKFRKAVFQNLRTTCLHLKALEFIGVVDKLATSELESLLFSYPEGLTELSIRFFRGNISNALLEAIAVRPRLQYLTLQIGYKSMPLRAPQPFQALTHLHMSCESLSLFSSLLHSISGTNSGTSGCPNLKKIYNIALRCGPTGIWSELLTILTRIKLEHISIIEKCNSEPHPCYTGPTFFELHPFLARPTALVNIKTLLIFPAHGGSIILTDADVHTLARACPHLYSVSLGNHNTPVSLGALGYIVRRCHELYEISLCADARLDALGTIPLDDDEQMYLQPNRRLRRLAIGGSPIACVGPLNPPTAPDLMMSIPRFLHMIAPRLAKLEISFELHFEWTYRRYMDMKRIDNTERWKKVEDVLSELAQGDTD